MINTTYVFIDASNLWEAQKARGKFFDYIKLEENIWGRELRRRTEVRQ